MDILQIVSIGLVSAILAVTVKQYAPEFGAVISITACVFIFMLILPKLAAVLELLKTIAASVDTDMSYVSTVLKIIGIAYVSQLGAELCADAGESAVASKIELAGKVIIMLVSAPILFGILDLIQSMLSVG